MTVAAVPGQPIAQAVSQAIVTTQPGDNVCLGEFTTHSGLIGGTNPETFSRASDHIIEDFEGLLKTIPSGMPARSGARFVINLATALTTHSVTVESGRDYAVTIKGDNGTTCVLSDAASDTLTADGTNRITHDNGTPVTASTATLTLTITGTLTQVQVEDVTGQTVQVSSEYVGLNTSQYFPYKNGNTVDANGVVTEARGDAIVLSTLKGQVDEMASTNLCTESEDLTAWATNGTPAAAVTADNSVGPDGLSSMDNVANNGTHSYSGRMLSVSLANSTEYALTYQLRNVDSLLTRIGIYNNTTAAWESYVDVAWSGGTPSTSASSGASDITYTENSLFSGLWEVTFTFTSTASAGSQSTDITCQPDRNATSKSVDFGYIQCEASAHDTSYIKTEGASATRVATRSTYPSAGVFRENDMCGVIVVRPGFDYDTDRDDNAWLWGEYTSANDYIGLFLQKTKGTPVLRKKVNSTSYQTSATMTSTYSAGDILVVAWRYSSINGMDCWLHVVGGSTEKMSNNTNTDDYLLSGSLYFGDQNAGAAEDILVARKYFQTYFGDVPDSVIEAEINRQAALHA